MARKFSFPTVQDIVDRVRAEGIPLFSRSTFYRLVRDKGWVVPNRTEGHWRRFSSNPNDVGSVEYYVSLIKKHYGVLS